jgi:hypothetical protein
MTALSPEAIAETIYVKACEAKRGWNPTDWPAALETDAAANAAGLAGCVTDWECELAERAAIAAFEILCFEGKVPCIDRRKEVKK